MSNKEKSESGGVQEAQVQITSQTAPQNVNVKIETEFYSNLAFVVISPRDVYVDFVRMPGVTNGESNEAKGIRVYMSFAAAMRLSEVLKKTILDVEKQGRIESITQNTE